MLKCNFFIVPIVHWIFQLVSTTAEACENSVNYNVVWNYSRYEGAVSENMKHFPLVYICNCILKLEREVEIEVFLQLFSNLCFSISSLLA